MVSLAYAPCSVPDAARRVPSFIHPYTRKPFNKSFMSLLKMIVPSLCVMACLTYANHGLRADDANEPSSSSSTANAEATGLHVQFSLNRPDGNRYRRPYVAVWLEDQENFPVKTQVLWIQTEQPGPRWHRDLTRWYRNDRLRKVAEKTDLIDGISGATRGPGQYEAHFDGTDNEGQPLKPGKYTLCLEVAREHGTYQVIRHVVVWGDQPIEQTALSDNVEMSNVSISYRPSSLTGQ